MSMQIIQDAIVDKIASLPEIGMVDSTEGRQSADTLPWADSISRPLPLWQVCLVSGGTAPPEKRTSTAICQEYVWRIKGYFPYNFASDSARLWIEWLDQLTDAFLPNPALTVCALTKPLHLIANDYVYYPTAEGGKDLCHYAEFEFKTQEWVAIEP